MSDHPEELRRNGGAVGLQSSEASSTTSGESPETPEAEADAEAQERVTLPFFSGVQGVAPETDYEIPNDATLYDGELHDGQFSDEQVPTTHADRIEAVQAELRMQLDVNHEAGSNPIYAGFEFVRTNQTPSADEAPYVGAFLPLRVAMKFPELLLNDTIAVDDVYCADKLPRGTQVVVRPGVFRTLGRNRLTEVFGSTIAICLYLLAAAAGAIYLANQFLR